MSDVTEWYPANIKPVRIGVYEVTDPPPMATKEYPFESWRGFQFWNGESWGELGYKPSQAFLYRGTRSLFQGHHWRGLVRKQK